MNTEHPIDDLFARTLRDAELDPPQEVWHGVVRDRDGSNNANSSRWRRSGYVALLLLLLGAPTTWLIVRHNGDSNPAPPPNAKNQVIVPEQNDVQAKVPVAPIIISATEQKADEGITASQQTGHRSNVGPAARSKIVEPSVAAQGLSSDTKTSNADISLSIDRNKPNPERTDHDHTNATRVAGIPNPPGTHIIQEPKVAMLTSAPSITELPEVQVAVDRRAVDGAAAYWIDPLVIDIPRRTDSASAAQRRVVPYVVRNGNWWLGVQLDAAEMNGDWKGSAPFDAELNKAESWRDQRGVSVLFGRSWNSGFSIATGAGLSQRRSNFFYQVDRNGSSATLIDTSWVGSPLGITTVYTWNIDTIRVGEPGLHEKYKAANAYWQLRVPVELGFHKQVKRWSFGVRGGLLFNFTTSRDGRTLELIPSPADPLGTVGYFTRSIPLQQNSVNDRFALSLSATAGLDIGYLIGDRVHVSIGPAYIHDLASGSGPLRLSTEEIGGAVRLIYELPAHERTTK